MSWCTSVSLTDWQHSYHVSTMGNTHQVFVLYTDRDAIFIQRQWRLALLTAWV